MLGNIDTYELPTDSETEEDGFATAKYTASAGVPAEAEPLEDTFNVKEPSTLLAGIGDISDVDPECFQPAPTDGSQSASTVKNNTTDGSSDLRSVQRTRSFRSMTMASLVDLGGTTPTSTRTRGAFFFNNPNMLRGIRIKTLLCRMGSILQNSTGNDETYEKSEVVDSLGTFVSHNWVVSRFIKFSVLAYHFNFKISLFSSSVAALIAFCAVSLNLVPFLPEYEENATFLRAPYCTIAANTILWMGILFGHELLPFSCYDGCRSHAVFFDKTCIHQTDEALKRKLIERLGAFVFYSSGFLVVHSDAYFDRLWTVYEFATFFLVHPGAQADILPVSIPRLVAIGNIIPFIAVICFWLSSLEVCHESNVAGALWYSVYICAFVAWQGFTLAERNFHRGAQQLYWDLERFSIRKSKCANEIDRRLVYANIISLLKDTQLVDRFASEAEALDAFDSLIQTRAPKLVRASLGKTGIRYKDAFMIWFPMYCFSIDKAASALAVYGNKVTALMCLSDLPLCLGMGPVFLYCGALLTGKFDYLRGWQEKLWTGGCGLVAGIVFGVTVELHCWFRELVRSQLKAGAWFMFIPWLALIGAWLAGALSCYCQRRPKVSKRRLSTDGTAGLEFDRSMERVVETLHSQAYVQCMLPTASVAAAVEDTFSV